MTNHSTKGRGQGYMTRFRSTLRQSRRNKAGVKSVRAQKVSSISIKFGMYVEVDE